MRGIFDGFVKWIFLLLALGAGFVFVLKTFLNPPKSSFPIAYTPESSSSLSPPLEESKTSQDVSNNQSPKTSEFSNSEIAEDNQRINSQDEPELIQTNQEKNNIPTIKKPEEYVLEIPPKLEEGAELKIFVNNDNSVNPNPANYSPSKIIKTQNIVLAPEERDDIFQESTGYFKVSESGEYNFLIERPDNRDRYYDDGRLIGKVDQEPLGNPRGGRVELDQGWHRLDLFYNPQNYAKRIDELEITVKMGRPGEVAETIDIWRAVEVKKTAQELKTKQDSN